jgi:AbrB family looped-hinge helix DNA binding protein
MKGTVSERGQVTIPKRLREQLGIAPGQVLDFDIEAGRLVATKRLQRDPVDAVYGVLGRPGSTDEAITELRGEPDAVDHRGIGAHAR